MAQQNAHTTIDLFSVPRIGVATFIIKNINGSEHVLIGKRKGSHGVGCYQLPGGHLDYGESWEVCAEREIKEETNLDVKDVTFVTCTNDIFEIEKRHYNTIFMRAYLKDENQEPELLEPNKCEGWSWVSINELKNYSPLFTPLDNFLKLYPCQKIVQ